MNAIEQRLDRLDEAWQTGYRAYERGLHTHLFGKNSALHKAWCEGYERARHEYEDAPPEE